MGFQLITCIVERDLADGVVDAAIKAGAQAATFHPTSGRGVRERIGFTQREKEIVLVVTKSETTKNVFDAMVSAGSLKQLGKGFAYIQPVEQAIGFID